jgi:hypothetical protein
MALLTPEQIKRLQEIIRDTSTALAIETAGHEVPEEEIQRLVDEGYIVAPDDLSNIVQDAFSFGQLMEKVEGIKHLPYPKFETYIAKNPVILSPVERQAYTIAKDRAGMLCVGLGNRYSEELGTVLIEADQELAEKTRAIIRDEVAVATVERKTVKQLKSRLGKMTGDWERDWDRIAATESQLSQQEGFLLDAAERHGEEVLLAKMPEPTACEDCLRLYLGTDGKPVIHPASWWQEQGVSNFGRKRKEWKAVLGAMHPWCFPEGQRVLTSRGEIPIETVQVGDLALSAEGKWRRVSQTFKHFYKGDLIKIHTLDSEIRATPKHLFFDRINGWMPAQTFGEGGHIRKIFLPKTDQPPSIKDQPLRLAKILLGFSRTGMPIAAVDFDGDLARPIYKIDQKAANNLIRLEGKVCSCKCVKKPLFKCREDFSFGSLHTPDDYVLRLDTPLVGFMSSAGQLFTFLGGQALHTDMVRFRSRALASSSLFNVLDDGASCHPQLVGYRLYGEIISEVQFNDQRDVKSQFSHDSNAKWNDAVVKSVHCSPFEGFVFNLGIEEDESYVVEGIATHNCRCQLIRIPEGWGLNDDWDVVPESMLKKSKGGPFIGPRGGKWKDPKHTIPWKEPEQLELFSPERLAEKRKVKVSKKKVEIPEKGKLTPKYVRGLMKGLDTVLNQSVNTLDASVKKVKNVSNFVERLEQDLLFTRGLWVNSGPPKKEASKETKAKYKLQACLVKLKEKIEGAGDLVRYHRKWVEMGAQNKFADQRTQQIYQSAVAKHGSHKKVEEVLSVDSHEDLLGRTSGPIKEIKKALKVLATHSPERTSYLRQFKVGDLSVVFQDLFAIPSQAETAEDRARLRHPISEKVIGDQLKEVQGLLAQKGFGHLWKGNLFVRAEEEGRRYNPETKKWEEAAGEYFPGENIVKIYRHSDIPYIVAHELGHRLWVKQLTSAQRLQFKREFEEKRALPISEYGKKDEKEDFAELFAYFVLDQKFSQKQKERFNFYIKKAFDEEDTLNKARKLHGRITFQGLDISIENRKGSVRHWYDPRTDTRGETKMEWSYGYIRLTEGVDGDHVDVFIGPHKSAPRVFVIHQMRAPDFEKYDEDKCMLGFSSAVAAKAAYLKHFDSPRFFGGMTILSMGSFKEKLEKLKGKMIKASSATDQMWKEAIKAKGFTPEQFSLVVKYADQGHLEARTALTAVQDLVIKAIDNSKIVATMGHFGRPTRTVGENVRPGKTGGLSEDWPLKHKKGKRGKQKKKRKLRRAAERYDLMGESRGKGGWANHPKMEEVVAHKPEARQVDAKKAKESLIVQQEGRQALRQGSKLNNLEVHR